MYMHCRGFHGYFGLREKGANHNETKIIIVLAGKVSIEKVLLMVDFSN